MKSLLADTGSAQGVRQDEPVDDFASAPGGSDSTLIVLPDPPPEKLGMDMLGIQELADDQFGDDEHPANAAPQARMAIALLTIIPILENPDRTNTAQTRKLAMHPTIGAHQEWRNIGAPT